MMGSRLGAPKRRSATPRDPQDSRRRDFFGLRPKIPPGCSTRALRSATVLPRSGHPPVRPVHRGAAPPALLWASSASPFPPASGDRLPQPGPFRPALTGLGRFEAGAQRRTAFSEPIVPTGPWPSFWLSAARSPPTNPTPRRRPRLPAGYLPATSIATETEPRSALPGLAWLSGPRRRPAGSLHN
jgi:hypothetical protein